MAFVALFATILSMFATGVEAVRCDNYLPSLASMSFADIEIRDVAQSERGSREYMIISADVTLNLGDDPVRALIWKTFSDQPIDTAFKIEGINFDALDFLAPAGANRVFYGYQRTDRMDKIMIAAFAFDSGDLSRRLEFHRVLEVTKPNGLNELLSLSIIGGRMELTYEEVTKKKGNTYNQVFERVIDQVGVLFTEQPDPGSANQNKGLTLVSLHDQSGKGEPVTGKDERKWDLNIFNSTYSADLVMPIYEADCKWYGVDGCYLPYGSEVKFAVKTAFYDQTKHVLVFVATWVNMTAIDQNETETTMNGITETNTPYFYEAWAYDQLGGQILSDFDSLQMLPYWHGQNIQQGSPGVIAQKSSEPNNVFHYFAHHQRVQHPWGLNRFFQYIREWQGVSVECLMCDPTQPLKPLRLQGSRDQFRLSFEGTDKGGYHVLVELYVTRDYQYSLTLGGTTVRRIRDQTLTSAFHSLAQGQWVTVYATRQGHSNVLAFQSDSTLRTCDHLAYEKIGGEAWFSITRDYRLISDLNLRPRPDDVIMDITVNTDMLQSTDQMHHVSFSDQVTAYHNETATDLVTFLTEIKASRNLQKPCELPFLKVKPPLIEGGDLPLFCMRVGNSKKDHLLWNEDGFEEAFGFQISETNCEDVAITYKLEKLPDAAGEAGLTKASMYKQNQDVMLRYQELQFGAPYGYMRGLQFSLHLEKNGRVFAESSVNLIEVDLLLLEVCNPTYIGLQRNLESGNDYGVPIRITHTIGQKVQHVPLPKDIILTNFLLQHLNIDVLTTDLMEYQFSAANQFGNAFPSSVISVSSKNMDVDNKSRFVSINPLDELMVGTHLVTVKFKYIKEDYFYNEFTTAAFKSLFREKLGTQLTDYVEVEIKKNTAPHFRDQNLADVNLDVGEEAIVELPPIIDDQGDFIIIDDVVMSSIAEDFIVANMQQGTGVTLPSTLFVKPTKRSHAGAHILIFPLRDENIVPKHNKVRFLVNVTWPFEDEEGDAKFSGVKELVEEFKDSELVVTTASLDEVGQMVIDISKKILVPKNMTKFIEKFKNNTIGQKSANLKSSDSDESELIDINVVLFSDRKIILQLVFKDAMAVSTGQDMDNFLLTINNTDTLFKTKEGGIPEMTAFILSGSLPPQLPANSTLYESMQNATESVETAMTSIFGLNFGLNFLLSGSLQFMWGTINTLQLSVGVGLVELNMPSNTKMLTTTLIGITTFDFMKADDVSETLFEFTPEMDEPFNDNFDKLDYSTHAAIVNLGSAYYILVALGMIALVKLQFKLLSHCTKKSPRISESFKKIEGFIGKMLAPSVFLRLLIESYFDMAIGAILNLFTVSFDNFSAFQSTILAYILAFFVVVSPFVVFVKVVLIFKNDKFEDEVTSRRWGEIYSSFRPSSLRACFYYAFFFLRRLFIVLSVTMIQGLPIMQLAIQLYLTIWWISYMMDHRPFEDPQLNYIEIVNEILFLMQLEVCYLFTDHNVLSPQQKFAMGWYYVGLILFMLVINSLVMLFQQCVLIYQKTIAGWHKMLNWYKQKKSARKLAKQEALKKKQEAATAATAAAALTDNQNKNQIEMTVTVNNPQHMMQANVSNVTVLQSVKQLPQIEEVEEIEEVEGQLESIDEEEKVEPVIKKKPLVITQYQAIFHKLRRDPFANQRPHDVPLPEIELEPNSHPLRGSEESEVKLDLPFKAQPRQPSLSNFSHHSAAPLVSHYSANIEDDIVKPSNAIDLFIADGSHFEHEIEEKKVAARQPVSGNVIQQLVAANPHPSFSLSQRGIDRKRALDRTASLTIPETTANARKDNHDKALLDGASPPRRNISDLQHLENVERMEKDLQYTTLPIFQPMIILPQDGVASDRASRFRLGQNLLNDVEEPISKVSSHEPSNRQFGVPPKFKLEDGLLVPNLQDQSYRQFGVPPQFKLEDGLLVRNVAEQKEEKPNQEIESESESYSGSSSSLE